MIIESPRIYNIFPRLLGKFEAWAEYLPRIRDMNFNWIYINPFQYPGFSGSLYSIKDYYSINPVFIDQSCSDEPEVQLETFVARCHSLGFNVMMDLVINHTAKDHPFTLQHPEWYKKNGMGFIVSPGVWDNGVWIEWGDLAEIDNGSYPERQELWNYWRDLIDYNIDIGFDGFRADAAYRISKELWDFLINSGKKKKSDLKFFAESLGCTIEKTVELSRNGFDYIFNSSKWWNYRDGWLLDQYEKTMPFAPSISFPESHDTDRLFFEAGGCTDLIKQRTLFTAFFSSGWMIPIGFEFGFRKKLDVVKTAPSDWETVNIDLTSFIKEINSFKKSFAVLNEEATQRIIETGSGEKEDFIIIRKISKRENEIALTLINRSGSGYFSFFPAALKDLEPYSNMVDFYRIFPGDGGGGKKPFSELTLNLRPFDAKLVLLKLKEHPVP